MWNSWAYRLCPQCKLWADVPCCVVGGCQITSEETGCQKCVANAMGYYFNMRQPLRLSLQELLLSKERGISSFDELYLR